MARVRPDHPRYEHQSEEVVVRALADQLDDQCLVVVGQHISSSEKEHEVDALVVVPDTGIIAVEIKSGQIQVNERGQWQQGYGRKLHDIDPVNQCRDALYALRQYVESDSRWTLGRQRWTHLVVCPHTTFPPDFSQPECPRRRVVDQTQLDEIGDICRWLATTSGPETLPRLPAVAVELVDGILASRGLPQRDVVARARENAEIADALTREQSVLLRAIDVLPRVEIRGGAGSGKTFLALEQARRLSKAGHRVALLCYSHGLASYLRQVTAGWSRREQPGYVGEFHSWGVSRGCAHWP